MRRHVRVKGLHRDLGGQNTEVPDSQMYFPSKEMTWIPQ